MLDKSILKFKYIFDNNYNPKYINGAYGGITPKGEIALTQMLLILQNTREKISGILRNPLG